MCCAHLCAGADNTLNMYTSWIERLPSGTQWPDDLRWVTELLHKTKKDVQPGPCLLKTSLVFLYCFDVTSTD